MTHDARQLRLKFPAAATVLCCQQCGSSFVKTSKCKPYRKFCGRKCYRESRRDYENVAYPQVWHNGKREYLHRVICMEATGDVLAGDEIVHHKDGNPFNRDPANLVKMPNRLEHLREHNFHRPTRRRVSYDPDFGF